MTNENGTNSKKNEKIKLLDFIKLSGFVSTSAKGKRLIRDELVMVNGIRCTSASQMVIPSQVKITITPSGNICANLKATVDPILIAYHKPCNVICTTSTHGNHPFTLMELYTRDRPIPYHFKPVGRLDQHSHGLLLFSSDGRLTSSLLSPKTSINRTYEIVVQGNVGTPGSLIYNTMIQQVKNGVETKYGIFKGLITKMQCDIPSKYVHLDCGPNCGGKRNDGFGARLNSFTLSSITISINEGKKRMIRRLFASLGYFVVDLKRVSYGEVVLGNLEYGEWRFATASELEFATCLIEDWGKG